MQTLLIDNYDSFTYNLFNLIASVSGVLPIVIKNDELSLQALSLLNFDNIVVSPGPGNPACRRDIGIARSLIQSARYPLLGVCLGYQSIAHEFGATVKPYAYPRHGRVSSILHQGDPLFHGIPLDFKVVRYHSLHVCHDAFPNALKSLAFSQDDQVMMALKHYQKPLWGVQFHPESIVSEYGEMLIKNFNDLTKAYYDKFSC